MEKDSNLQVGRAEVFPGREVPEWEQKFLDNIREKGKGSFEERVLAGLNRIIELLENMINPITYPDSNESDATEIIEGGKV